MPIPKDPAFDLTEEVRFAVAQALAEDGFGVLERDGVAKEPG